MYMITVITQGEDHIPQVDKQVVEATTVDAIYTAVTLAKQTAVAMGQEIEPDEEIWEEIAESGSYLAACALPWAVYIAQPQVLSHLIEFCVDAMLPLESGGVSVSTRIRSRLQRLANVRCYVVNNVEVADIQMNEGWLRAVPCSCFKFLDCF